MSKYKNIPSTGFISSDVVTKTQTALTTFNQSAYLSFSLFSIIQMLFGAKTTVENTAGDTIPKRIVAIYMKLNECFMIANAEHSAEITIQLQREEVELLLQFILSRMQHCEKERDEQSSKFNPDTYIGMKILILELKEWLMGSVIVLDHNGLTEQEAKDEYALNALESQSTEQ